MPTKEPTKEEIIDKIKNAIQFLLDERPSLLEKDVSERAISGKLAHYLQIEFGEYDVDCEYNRHLKDPKRLEAVRDYVRIQRNNGKLSDIEEDFGICVSPDVVIHERGTDEDNLLIIEIKKKENPLKEKEYDLLKINGYTEQIGYSYGLYLEFGVKDNSEILKAELFTEHKKGAENIISKLTS